MGTQAADAEGILGGVIRESTSELLAGQVANPDDVALLEFAGRLRGCQWRVSFSSPIPVPRGRRRRCNVRGVGLSGRSNVFVLDGTLPCARNKVPTGSPARMRVKRFGLGSGCDDHRAAGLSHEPRRGQLALHAAGPQRAAAGTRQREHLVVDLRHQANDFGIGRRSGSRCDTSRRPRSR